MSDDDERKLYQEDGEKEDEENTQGEEHITNNVIDNQHSAALDDWDAAYDQNTQKWYYYNKITGETSWKPPPHWVANEPTTSTDYFYTDAYGKTQGPFNKETLFLWRGMLPMDLQVWHQIHTHEDASQDKDNTPSTLKKIYHDFADITGDTSLLYQWKKSQSNDTQSAEGIPTTSEHACRAPTALDYEKSLHHNQHNQNQQNHQLENNDDSSVSFAEAALAGMPDDDPAKQVALAALTSGKSIDDALQEVRQQQQQQQSNNNEYTATVYHTAGRGRIQSAHAMGKEGLYAEFKSWDPTSIDTQMKSAQQRGKRALTSQEIRSLKQKKSDMKEKKLKSWLLSD